MNKIKKFALLLIPFGMIIWFTASSAHATSIVVWNGPYLTKTYQITEQGSAIYRPSGNVSLSWGASGGCWLDTVRKPNGKIITLGVKCFSAGTVYATTPAMPSCNSVAGVLRNGVSIILDSISPKC